ncbi:Glutamate receptor-like protein [Quillaja saponaria]|uniref:Glutamate receptor-like protein n=1 Tax=Quillaja saponaria TaxID=32244 RepID=A0AAD7LE53_QUISA|nr:Glutamate receptor-like protein [Quillaja saponaria]
MANYLGCLLSSVVLLNLLQFRVVGSSATASTTPMEAITLRIGVPKKDSFTEFVNVFYNHTDKYDVTGFCIDVFNAVLENIPSFKISPEFKPYVDEKGKSAGSYDDLLHEIPKKTYDAVVGDVTILADRATYVDFTLPYTKTGVKMLVRVKYGRHLNMWIFLRPFSWDLWLAIIIFCIFIGGVILIMERNVNISEDSSPSSPLATPQREQLKIVSILWLPLSQVVIPQREMVAKNCSRFVLVVWLVLAFVLLQSYTASYSSMLTVDQLQPRYMSVKELIEKGHKVGYRNGSFVKNQLLVQRLKFDPSNVMPFGSIDEYRHALKSGIVSAIFVEVPYIKALLKKYGSKYVTVGPIYPTDGLGFAFPYNSNLTSYFSRAILNVTQSETIYQLEKKHFGSSTGALEAEDVDGEISSDSASPSLTAYSFGGLFMITGIATFLALLVSESVIWRKPFVMAKAYSQRYFSSARRRINNGSPTYGSSTTRRHVNSIDEGNVDGQSREDDHLESPSRTRDHINQDAEGNNSSDEGLIVEIRS